MSREDNADIREALHLLAQADRILDDVSPSGDSGNGDIQPAEAAHVWIFRAMCLLIDSLNGVETTAFSNEENIPVAQTPHPYDYLSKECEDLLNTYRDRVEEHSAPV